MYLLGAVLLPFASLLGLFTFVYGAATGRDHLAIAGAILCGAMVLAMRKEGGGRAR